MKYLYIKGNMWDGVLCRAATFDGTTLGKEHQENTSDGFILARVPQYGNADLEPQDIGKWRTASSELTEAIRQAMPADSFKGT